MTEVVVAIIVAIVSTTVLLGGLCLLTRWLVSMGPGLVGKPSADLKGDRIIQLEDALLGILDAINDGRIEDIDNIAITALWGRD